MAGHYLVEFYIGLELERRALDCPTRYGEMLVLLVVAAVCARWLTAALAKSLESVLRFVEEPIPAVLPLGLHRDGVLPV
jgi:hypothetical protein